MKNSIQHISQNWNGLVQLIKILVDINWVKTVTIPQVVYGKSQNRYNFEQLRDLLINWN